jgi:uncharacterized cupin superfamily protein
METTRIAPITLAAAQAVALRETGPRADPLSGTPVESSAPLYSDAQVDVGVWECTPGSFRAARDGFGEVAHVVGGRGTLVSDSGEVTELVPGAVVVTPEGWTGTWTIEQTLRKLYVIWHAAQRA